MIKAIIILKSGQKIPVSLDVPVKEFIKNIITRIDNMSPVNILVAESLFVNVTEIAMICPHEWVTISNVELPEVE